MCLTMELKKEVDSCVMKNKQFIELMNIQDCLKWEDRNCMDANNIYFKYVHWCQNERDLY